MPRTLAIVYSPADYSAADRRPVGRRAATGGLLNAIAAHSDAEELLCLAHKQSDFHAFCSQVEAATTVARRLTWVPVHESQRLAAAHVVIRPDPIIDSLAWTRRSLGQRAFSLFGMTHNISTPRVMAAIGALAVAPVQEWDAIVCPSQAVRTALERTLADWCDYLAARTGGAPAAPLRLPVIPLGIDTAAFRHDEQRAAARQDLGLGPEDVAFLFVGRLGPRSKAHPVPMYVALERAAAHVTRTLHLIQAGWFADPGGEQAFRAAAAAFAPSVRHRFLDGGRAEIRALAWAAADVFVSLADNVQETFGLTPVEAMSAGLPVVVTDWDGYRETVRDGEDGFLVPTSLPETGAGADLAAAQHMGVLGYFDFIGHAAAATACDIDAAATAFARLAGDAELRARMGASGRQRARELYDWSAVVAAYETLWDELDEVRARALESVGPRPAEQPHPLHPDPFHTYAHYATRTWGAGDRLVPADGAHELLRLAETDALAGYAAGRRLAPSAAAELVDAVAAAGGMDVAALLDAAATDDPAARRRAQLTIGALLKLGVLKLERGA